MLASGVILRDMSRRGIHDPGVAASVHSNIRYKVQANSGGVQDAGLADLLLECAISVELEDTIAPRVRNPDIRAINTDARDIVEVVGIVKVCPLRLPKRLTYRKLSPGWPRSTAGVVVLSKPLATAGFPANDLASSPAGTASGCGGR